jgi:hypothetical protein
MDKKVKINTFCIAWNFSERLVLWTRTHHAQRMINAILKAQNCDLADLLIVNYGGNRAGI